MQILIDKTTRQVIAYGDFPTPPADPAVALLTVAAARVDATLAQVQIPGLKTAAADGTISAAPLLPPPVDPSIAKRAAAVAALKSAAGGAGAQAALAQAILDLNGIT